MLLVKHDVFDEVMLGVELELSLCAWSGVVFCDVMCDLALGLDTV